MRSWILQVLMPVLGVVLFLAGLIALGRLAQERLRTQDRFILPFADIACEPPPGMSRGDFLAEVQYLGDFPDRLELLQDGLTPRLAAAFVAHPWVEKVDRLEIGRGRVSVTLTYRTPVLAVPLVGSSASRAVDRKGILLPTTVITSELPILERPLPRPAGPPGRPWGDPAVEAAAATASFLQPQLRFWALDRIAVTTEGVILAGKPERSRVVWGSAPGAERPGEPGAAEKLQRLLHYCAVHGSLERPDGPYEHDVRPADQPAHRALASLERP